MEYISTREEALPKAWELMKLANAPQMIGVIEQAMYDARWYINSASTADGYERRGVSREESDEPECLALFVASYNRLVRFHNERRTSLS